MKHYTEEVIIIDGIKYVPTTDVLHEEFNGLLSNVIKNEYGKRYKAFYDYDHLEKDEWNDPLYIVEMLDIEQA